MLDYRQLARHQRAAALGGSTIAAVRFLFLFLVFFGLSTPLHAQGGFTTVTGTITGPDSLIWACGSISAQLITAGGASPTLNGGGFTTQTSPVSLGCPTTPGTGAPGSFVMRLADSGVIVPSNTTWRFTVNMTPGIAPPQGTGPQSFSFTSAINCGTNTPATCISNQMDISAQLSALAPKLSNSSGGGTKFDTNGIYVTTACGGATNCFQVLSDVQVTTNASYSNGSQTVTTVASDPAFVAGDVGKIEFAAGRCTGDVSRCFYDVPQGTISVVVSAHNITVSAAATNTSSGTNNANNFAWGHDDGAQLLAAFNALFPLVFVSTAAIPQPQKALSLSCGMMFTSLPLFVTPVPTDTQGGGIAGCGGAGGTVIIPLPKMNCNTTNGCLFADNNNNQIGNGLNNMGWHVRDLTFWGLGTDVKDAAATFTSGNAGIYTNFFDELENVWVVGWLWNQANSIGAKSVGSTWLASGAVGAGNSACVLTSIASTAAVMTGGQCGGSNSASITISGATSIVHTTGIYGNQYFGASNCSGSAIGAITVTGGTWVSTGDSITQSVCVSGGSVYLTGTTVNQTGGGNSVLGVTGGNLHLSNTQIRATGTPITQSGGTIYDNCGNGILPAPGSPPVITNLYGSCSITGVADVLANHVLTSNWGTSAVSAVTGSTNDVKFTITTTVGGAAGPVLTDTFAVPYWATPGGGCILTQVGGTFGVITNPVPSALSRTGVTWTFAGTPSANTYIFARHCAN
jgi:hypothetical protein